MKLSDIFKDCSCGCPECAKYEKIRHGIYAVAAILVGAFVYSKYFKKKH